MNIKGYQLEKFRKYLLNRVTVTPQFIEYVESCLSSEEECAHHSFHKIMIHNWAAYETSLLDALAEYYTVSFVPVNFTSQGSIITFYTSSLNLVLRITKLDFMFPHHRNMFSIDILFNDKTSADCFGNRITVDDVVTGVVSNRFTPKCELNLSDICNDQEFIQNKIHFYKLSLLTHFKILMLRMGRDAKSLNLSNNNISQIPLDILNFFMKGNLIGINLSNNKLSSLQELNKINRKIEKIWLEGNPLCENLDPLDYVKHVTMKFPRLTELDGINLNEHGIMLPFFKNFLETPDAKTKMLIDKFLRLYFSHYDAPSRNKIDGFYDGDAELTIATNFTEIDGKKVEEYANHSRNILNQKKKVLVLSKQKIYRGRNAIRTVFSKFPETEHDPISFTVDVLKHDKKTLMLVLDGVFREKSNDEKSPYNYYHFRRTFIFKINNKSNTLIEYLIQYEMFNISYASKEVIDQSFQHNSRGTNPLALQSPTSYDVQAMCNIFSSITGLRTSEADKWLKIYNYDIAEALKYFMHELRADKVAGHKFVQNDDFSDTSSLVDEEID